MGDASPVLVIGSLNMDLVARCDHLPRLGQTVFGSHFLTAAGGKGANQAVAAARLGAHVTMAGCVGNDQFGRTLLDGLRSDGVRCALVEQVARPTGTALITVDAQGANTIVVISGANMACDAALAGRALASVDGPGVLLLQHEIPDAANAAAIRAARAAGWFIVLNPAPSRRISPQWLPLIDLIAPNQTEAAALSGTSDPETAAEYLLAQGAAAVLVTLGEAGALYRRGAEGWRCPATAVQAIDTTAAGDAYIGALAAALAGGQSVPDSLGYAAAAAGLAVTRPGAQPSLGTRGEVAEFIARYGAPRAVAV